MKSVIADRKFSQYFTKQSYIKQSKQNQLKDEICKLKITSIQKNCQVTDTRS